VKMNHNISDKISVTNFNGLLNSGASRIANFWKLLRPLTTRFGGRVGAKTNNTATIWIQTVVPAERTYTNTNKDVYHTFTHSCLAVLHVKSCFLGLSGYVRGTLQPVEQVDCDALVFINTIMMDEVSA
jgi:hypothetical protein